MSLDNATFSAINNCWAIKSRPMWPFHVIEWARWKENSSERKTDIPCRKSMIIMSPSSISAVTSSFLRRWANDCTTATMLVRCDSKHEYANNDAHRYRWWDVVTRALMWHILSYERCLLSIEANCQLTDALCSTYIELTRKILLDSSTPILFALLPLPLGKEVRNSLQLFLRFWA